MSWFLKAALWSLTAIMFLCTAAFGQQVGMDTLSLQRLQHLAAQRAVSVLQATQDVEQAKLEGLRLRADLRPQVTLNATVPSYSSSFRETVQPDGTVRFQPVNINNSSATIRASQAFAKTGGELRLSTGLQRFDDFEQDLSIYNGSVARLSYAQPLWGFNPLKWRQRLVPAQQMQADAALREARLSAVLDATNAFFQLALARQAYTIADTNTISSEKLLVIARERFKLGKITRGDLSQLELDVVSAEQNRLASEQLMASASATIYNLLGLSYKGIIKPVTTDFDSPSSTQTPQSSLVQLQQAQLPSREAAIKAARQYRPEIQDARLRKLQAESALDQQRRTTGFQADLFASIGLVRSDPALPEIYRDPQLEQIVELGLSVPLIDWGRRKALVKQTEVALSLSEQLLARQDLNIETRTSLALEQADITRRQLELLARVRTLALERYRIVRESYLLGAVPLTDLTFAQQARDARLREYLSGVADAFTARATLNALTGLN